MYTYTPYRYHKINTPQLIRQVLHIMLHIYAYNHHLVSNPTSSSYHDINYHKNITPPKLYMYSHLRTYNIIPTN